MSIPIKPDNHKQSQHWTDILWADPPHNRHDTEGLLLVLQWWMDPRSGIVRCTQVFFHFLKWPIINWINRHSRGCVSNSKKSVANKVQFLCHESVAFSVICLSVQAVKQSAWLQPNRKEVNFWLLLQAILAAKLHKPIVIIFHMFKIVDTALMIFSFSICQITGHFSSLPHFILYELEPRKFRSFFSLFFAFLNVVKNLMFSGFQKGFKGHTLISTTELCVCVFLMQCCLKITTIQYWFPASFLVYWHSFNHYYAP